MQEPHEGGPAPDLTALLEDRFVRTAVRSAVHLRRHLALYVIALAVGLVAALLPTVRPDAGATAQVAAGDMATGGGVYGSGPATTGSTARGPGDAGGSGGGVAGRPPAAGGGGGGAVTSTGSGPGSATGTTDGVQQQAQAGKVLVGQGTTRGGFACKPGVRQIPWSAYAAPCIGAYAGDNGGATTRGVSRSAILLVDREYDCNSNCQASQQINAQAGLADPTVTERVAKTFIDYFNKVYELYGRKVVIKPWTSSANSTDEAQSKGQAQACADAVAIAKDVKAYGDASINLNGSGFGGSGPFAECAAKNKLVEFFGGAYYDETWYRQQHPYVWHYVMECERISHLVGEDIDKQLIDRKATWAGDVALQQSKRVFGTYVPNNPPYQRCADTTFNDLKKKHPNEKTYRYDYVLDLSRFADQANQAMVQFHSEGVTTIVLACDPYSIIFLTQAAASQGYHPEWYLIGAAGQDTDSFGRLYVPDEVDGHMFGLSQLGDESNFFGPKSEAGITYKKITGQDIPAGTDGRYYRLLQIFNMLQAAGPDLTPNTMAQGAVSLPEAGVSTDPAVPKNALGSMCFCTAPDGGKGMSHTTVQDTRIVYWDANATSHYDGQAGTFIDAYPGRRFKVGQIPAGAPAVYPQG